MHGLHQLPNQNLILGLFFGQQTQLLPHIPQIEAVVEVPVFSHYCLGPLWWQLWIQRLCQLHQVPPAYTWLGLVRVAARIIRGITDEIWIKP